MDLGHLVGNRIYLRIGVYPEIMDFRRTFVGKPHAFGDREIAARLQVFAPLVQAPLEADVVNRPLGPDQIQLPGAERQGVHRTDDALHPVGEVQSPGVGVETVDESREEIETRNTSRRMPGQRHRLTARPAAEVGDQGFVGQVVDETQRLDGHFGISRPLPFGIQEKIADQIDVKSVNGVIFVTHCLEVLRRTRKGMAMPLSSYAD